MPLRRPPHGRGPVAKRYGAVQGSAGTTSERRSQHGKPRRPQKESRRVGTRRLPYVGDRVGGLGVRPPALGYDYMVTTGAVRQSAPCPSGRRPSVRRGPQCVVAAMPSAVTAAHLVPTRAAQAAEHRKAPLLAVVEALVERICGVGQFLQGRAGVRHGCGALSQALDRIVAGLAHCASRSYGPPAACRSRAPPARRPASSSPARASARDPP